MYKHAKGFMKMFIVSLSITAHSQKTKYNLNALNYKLTLKMNLLFQ